MFTEDLSTFFADFGHTANFGAGDVLAFFDDGFERSSVGAFGMTTSQPAITLPSAQVPANPVGVSVVVTVDGSAVPYVVAEAQPDGTGITRLLLEVA